MYINCNSYDSCQRYMLFSVCFCKMGTGDEIVKCVHGTWFSDQKLKIRDIILSFVYCVGV